MATATSYRSATHFDADRYAEGAETKTLHLQGRDYILSGDPDCDLVTAIVRVEVARNTSDMLAQADAISEAKRLFIELLRETNDDVPAVIKVGMDLVSEIFAWLIGGDDNVQEEVADVLAGGLTPEEQAQAIADMEAAGELDPEDEDAEDVPLTKPSTKRSSRSASSTDGSRTTGKGSRGASSGSTPARRAAG